MAVWDLLGGPRPRPEATLGQRDGGERASAATKALFWQRKDELSMKIEKCAKKKKEVREPRAARSGLVPYHY